jgi:hypothetical protein
MRRTFLRVGCGAAVVFSSALGCSSGGSSSGSTTTTSSSSSSSTTTTGVTSTTTTGGGGGGSSTTGSGGAGGEGGASTTTTGAGASGGAGGDGGAGASTTTGAGGSGGEGGEGGQAATTTTGAGGSGGEGGAGSTTGAGGGAPFCVPGSTKPCYTGPEGTKDIGACKGGLATCDAQGSAFGPCAGEILPAVESCMTAIDEDCDGMTPPCSGATLWSHVVGAAVDDEGAAVAVDPSGNVLLAGYATQVSDFGCGAIDSGPNNSAVLVKYTPSGSCIWSKAFGVAGVGNISEVKALATDAGGNVYMLGYLIGTANFGGGNLSSTTPGESDVLLAKYGPDGAHLWSKRFGGASNQYARGAAVDSQGNVIITGFFFGTVDFGGGLLTSAGATDIYVAKFDASGAHLWSKRYGNVSGQESFAVAVDTSDNIVIAGTLKGTIDFGGGNLSSAGLGDAFVAKLGPAGAHVWSKRFGDAGDQTGAGVSVDAAGNVFAVGGFAGTINFGGANLVSQGATDAWIAKLSPAGAHLWSKAGAGPDNQVLSAVSADAFGNVTATGYSSNAADFGGGNLVSEGGQDIVIARYDAGGAHLWSKRFGALGTEVGRAAAHASTGEVYVTGLVTSPTDFGGGLMAGGGGEDIYLVKLAP